MWLVTAQKLNDRNSVTSFFFYFKFVSRYLFSNHVQFICVLYFAYYFTGCLICNCVFVAMHRLKALCLSLALTNELKSNNNTNHHHHHHHVLSRQ